MGGFQRVSMERSWKKIADSFGVSASCTNSAFILKQTFVKYLKNLDDQSSHKNEETDEPEYTSDDGEDDEATCIELRIPPVVTPKHVRYTKALESGLPNEIDWALDELLRHSNENSPLMEVCYNVDLLVALLTIANSFFGTCIGEGSIFRVTELLGEVDHFCLLSFQRIITLLSNLVVSDAKLVVSLVHWHQEMSLLLKNCFSFYTTTLTRAGMNNIFLEQLVSAIVVQNINTTEYHDEMYTCLLGCLCSFDRRERQSSSFILGCLFKSVNKRTVQGAVQIAPAVVSKLLDFMLVIPDELLQGNVIDYLFNMADALENGLRPGGELHLQQLVARRFAQGAGHHAGLHRLLP